MHAPRWSVLLFVFAGCDMNGGPILTPDAGRDAGREEDAGRPEEDAGMDDGGPPADLEPPTIVSTSPEHMAVDVAAEATITVTFSEAMADGGTILLAVDGEEETEPAYTLDGTTLTFSATFPSSAQVRVTIERDFADLAGNELAAPYAFTFSVEDSVPPFVLVASPGESATGISARTTELRIMFSEPMDASAGTLMLEGGDGTLGAIGWTLGGIVVPVSGLEYDTSYRVVFTGFTDESGNALDGATYLEDGALDFTTGPDIHPPSVVDANPSEGQIEVADTRDTITVLFDEAMDSSITTATLNGVSVTGVWSVGDTQIDFDVDGRLARNAPHALVLDVFTDAAGNALDPEPHLGDGVLDFVTGVDIFAPYVGFTDPVEGSSVLSFRQNTITVVFSEAMDTSIDEIDIVGPDGVITRPAAWSLSGTRFTIDVTNTLFAAESYTIDFTGFTDAGGTGLDVAHAYLGDGVLSFTLADPTGENCHDALRMEDGTPIANGLEYVLAPEAYTVNDGSNSCRGGNTPGIDGVIHYRKTTPALSAGGTALRIFADSAETITNAWMAVTVLRDECEPSVAGTGPARLRCVVPDDPQIVHLDVGPGDYYVWFSRHTGDFRGATVRIEEVASVPDGEMCANPYDTSTAAPIYTAPASANLPHVWTIPNDAGLSVDHAVAHNGPGAMVCDADSFVDNGIGPDVVVALPKASATSIGWLEVRSVDTSYEMVAEVRDRCAPPEMVSSLSCAHSLRSTSTTADIFETTISGAAGNYYLWLSGDQGYAPFPGAIVSYRDIEPGPGDSCATAIPLDAGVNTINPDGPYRLPAPTCFGATQNVTWYRFTTTQPFSHVRASGAGNIAAIRASDASQIACQASGAGNTPIQTFLPVGTDVCVAVASGSGVTSLTLNSYAYTGNMGRPTQLGIIEPRSFDNDNWMVATPTTLYIAINGAGVGIAPRTGNATADFRTDLTTNLGQGGLAIGEAVWSLDDLATSNATPRLYRLVDSMGSWAPVPWEGGMTWPADGFDAITYDGTNILVTNDYATTLPVQLRTFSPTAPGPFSVGVPVHSTLRDVVAIAADTTWLYMVGGVQAATVIRGVYRIRRAELGTMAPELIASIPVNTTRGAIFVDSLTSPTYLYVRADNGEVHVVGDPGGATPVHLGAISTLGESVDEAMAYDRATNALFIIESETTSDNHIVRLD
jgi:methionine-rich copper-binding protein CopC